jgi:hypothetical protein
MTHKTFAALATLMLGAMSAPAHAAEATTSSPMVTTSEAHRTAVNVPSGVSRGSSAEEARYAAREAATPEAKKYKGGDVIVISATAVAIVLLVVLIIVLI